MDTIFALATLRGRSGVAIIRVSGADAMAGCASLMTDVPASKGLRRIYDKDGLLLDEALVLSFPAGQSFTGEETVELQTHGSPAVVAAVLAALGKIDGFRQAEAGEFTRRAMENDQLSLAEVEGLADLIDAETEAQRRQALRVFTGALSKLAASWRKDLIRAAALVEATIDFAEEEVPVDVFPEVGDLIETVQASLVSEAAGSRIAERLRDGFEVAIVGAPNVGKSTLLNALAGRDVAITSDIAGTTRDVIEVRMDLGGIPVTVLDTAGLRQTDDLVEGLGVARARDRAMKSDVRVHLVSRPGDAMIAEGPDDIVVQAKADLGGSDGLAVSGLTGEGLDALVDEISSRLSDRLATVGVAMRERHRLAIERAVDHLEEVRRLMRGGAESTDLIADELRGGVRAVDSIVGHVDVEDILDEIFSSFCIGK